MNEGTFCPSRAFAAIPQSKLWLTVRAVAAVLLAIALTGITGFAQNEPVQKSDSPAAIGVPAQQPPALKQLRGALPREPQLLEGSGVAVWAKEFQGQLIGLDGALYEGYRSAIIEYVQKALRDRGLYGGPMNGILDRPTMKSIYAFQEANNLQRCGVPTPHTRKMLQQGSHTDLTF
jgi:hypothetical protein